MHSDALRNLRANLRTAEQLLQRAEHGHHRCTHAAAFQLAVVLSSVRPGIQRALAEINNAILGVDDGIADAEGE